MNRIIKFRAWDTKTKQWLKAIPSERLEYLLDDPDAPISHHDTDDEGAIFSYPEYPLGSTFNDRIIYQQFTGLKDKNGKEIYEGDIIHSIVKQCSERGEFENYTDESKFIVEFGNGVFGKKDRWKGISPLADGSAGWHWTTEKYDIIGNIFENPELIK